MSSDPMKKAMVVVASLKTDPSFIERVIHSNSGALKGEYPEANPETILAERFSVDEFAASQDEWKRVLAGLIYANIALGAMQLYKKELRDRDSYFLASIYSWSRSAEILASTNSKALFMMPHLLVSINETYSDRKIVTTSFVVGLLQKIWRSNKRKAISFAVSIIIEYSKRRDLVSEALEILGWAQRRVKEHMRDKELLQTLMRIEKRILESSERWEDAVLTADRLSELEEDPVQKLVLLLDKSEYLYLQNLFEESVKTIDRIQMSESYADLPEREKIRALLLKAHSLMKIGRHREALRCLEDAERISEKLGLTLTRIEILVNIGSLLLEIDEYRPSIETFKKALELLEKQKEDTYILRLRAKILYGLGLSLASVGYFRRGLTLLEEAYKILLDLKPSDDKSYEELAVLLARIIAININLRRWDIVQELLDRFKEIINNVGDPHRLKRLHALMDYLNTIYNKLRQAY